MIYLIIVFVYIVGFIGTTFIVRGKKEVLDIEFETDYTRSFCVFAWPFTLFAYMMAFIIKLTKPMFEAFTRFLANK